MHRCAVYSVLHFNLSAVAPFTVGKATLAKGHDTQRHQCLCPRAVAAVFFGIHPLRTHGTNYGSDGHRVHHRYYHRWLFAHFSGLFGAYARPPYRALDLPVHFA